MVVLRWGEGFQVGAPDSGVPHKKQKGKAVEGRGENGPPQPQRKKRGWQHGGGGGKRHNTARPLRPPTQNNHQVHIPCPSHVAGDGVEDDGRARRALAFVAERALRGRAPPLGGQGRHVVRVAGIEHLGDGGVGDAGQAEEGGWCCCLVLGRGAVWGVVWGRGAESGEMVW